LRNPWWLSLKPGIKGGNAGWQYGEWKMSMRNLKLSIIIHVMLIYIFGCISVFASPVEKIGVKDYEGVKGTVKVTVSEDKITIADSISLKVEVSSPKGYIAMFPAFAEFGFSTDFNERSKRFRVTNVTEVEKTIMDDGATLLSQEFTLEPWLSGNYSILPLMVPFFKEKSEDNPNNKKDKKTGEKKDERKIPAFNVMTDGMRIKVDPLTDMRQELSDLYGQSDYKLEKLTKRVRRNEDKSDEELLREQEEENETIAALKKDRFPWWIVWVILIMPIIVLFVRYMWKGRISKIFKAKSKPADEIAYKAFEKLRSKNFPAQGKIKEFYYEISYILRNYIGNRFGIYAINQTTEEFFTHLIESNPFDKGAEDILRTFSDNADTVKYSLFRPEVKVTDQSFQTAKSFVDRTRAVDREGT
jgi:hypothetical protein